MPKSHEMLIVSGPNGSGKTTMAKEFADQLGYPYISADAIAESLSSENPASHRIEAGRQFVSVIANTISEQKSVIIESTLSGRMFAQTIHRARNAGYSVSIVHLFLDSADTCVARVAERVQKGGHEVPEKDIRRRFSRSAKNFWHLYRPLCKHWVLMYNSTTDAQPFAEGDSQTHSIQDSDLFDSFIKVVHSND